jgi:hypothetical protein
MVAEVLTLTSWEKGGFIGGWKSGHWKKHEVEFGHKFSGVELHARWSGARPGGAELQAESFGERQMVRPRAD